MKVVAPLRIESEAELFGGCDDAGIVEIALGDRVDAAGRALRAFAHGRRQVLQERLGGMIDDRVHGIDAQAVDVKLIDPLQRVVNEEPAHVVAVRAVEIERQSPRRLVAVGEVRAVLAEIVSLGTEVVVDDVEEDGQAARVTGVDETLQRDRSAVRLLRRADVDAVVAPVRDRRETARSAAARRR